MSGVERIVRKSNKFSRKADNPELDASIISQGAEAERPIRKKKTGHLSAIYIQLFGKQHLKEYVTELKTKEYQNEDAQRQHIQEKLRQRIIGDIVRLRAIQDDSKEMGKVLERASGRATQQKWKLVVLSYRDRLRKAEQALFNEQRLRERAQEWIESEKEQAERLAHMNNLKFQKIDNLVADIADRDTQIAELGHTISQVTANCSSLKEELNKTSEILNKTLNDKEVLETSLAQERQKSILLEASTQQQPQKCTTVLLRGDQEVNREIADLKQKFEVEIAKKEARVEQQQVQIEALREQLQLINIDCGKKQQGVQTGESIVHACYYSSLHDQLGEQVLQEEGQYRQSSHSDGGQDEEQDVFTIPMQSNSVRNHHIYPDADKNVVMSDDEEDFITCRQQEEISFEDGRSVSNAPSHYVETLQELTQELSEAYAKINLLTTQMNELQQQKDKLSKITKKSSFETTTATLQSTSASSTQPGPNKSFGGYLSSFFKK